MTFYNRKAAMAAFDASYTLVLTPAKCCYCGGKVAGLDHVPCLRFVAAVGSASDRKLYLCCWSCNSLLGPHPALCLSERAAFLVGAYRAEWWRVRDSAVDGHYQRLRAIKGKALRLKARLAAGDVSRVCQCRACSADRISRGLA